jgi:hypothetical protein
MLTSLYVEQTEKSLMNVTPAKMTPFRYWAPFITACVVLFITGGIWSSHYKDPLFSVATALVFGPLVLGLCVAYHCILLFNYHGVFLDGVQIYYLPFINSCVRNKLSEEILVDKDVRSYGSSFLWNVSHWSWYARYPYNEIEIAAKEKQVSLINSSYNVCTPGGQASCSEFWHYAWILYRLFISGIRISSAITPNH